MARQKERKSYKANRQRERKAKSTLLLAIPNEYQLRFHGIKDAKTLWATIKSRFGGNVEYKKMQKTVLKQQFENFSVSDTKGLDKAYDRFQKLISLLEVHGAAVFNEDANQKFLRALPSSWNNVALIMRTKTGIDDLDIDDLYNNHKVFEADIKSSSGSSSNSPNVAFLSAEDTNNINEVNTASSVSTVSCHNSQGQASSSTYTNDLMFSFFANQSNSPQLDDEDLEQIDHDDLEEMDLKWQVAMLSMRVKRFYKKTKRKLIFNGKEPVGFDKTKDNALNVKDGLGYDWSYIAQDEPTEFALMAYTSNSSGSDTEVQSCSKNYVKTYEKLQKQFDEQRQTLSKANLEIIAYQLGLESVEAQLVVHQKNEVVYEEKIAVLEFEVNEKTVSAVKGNGVTAVKASAGCVWRPKMTNLNNVSKDNSGSWVSKRGNPQQALKNQGIFDSGCSRHMTGNKDFLTDYQKLDGGFVAFGGSARGEGIHDDQLLNTAGLSFLYLKKLCYIARNCTQPKRPQNTEYFKDKMFLMQAQENRVALDEEQLLFIAGGQDNAIDEDVDEQPVQDLAPNVDNVFQADDCDAFDSDVDEAPTAQTMFMAFAFDSDVAYWLENPLCLIRTKKVQPALYNGYEIIKNNHVPTLVHNTEDTPEIAEITRRKMNEKMKDTECVTHKVKITPPDYSKENYLATFTSQKQLTPEQIFWSQDLTKMKEEALKKQTTASRPIKALTVYPPNTPATLVPRVLPTKSQVRINIFALLQLFSKFKKTCKKRITPTGPTKGERGFEQTKECYLIEVIPFFKTLKEHFEGIQKALTKEIKEMKDIFEELEAEVDQNVVNRKHDEIEQKNLLIANDNLIADCLSKEVFYIATNSELTVSRFTNMHEAHTIVQTTVVSGNLKFPLPTTPTPMRAF
ncbi:hypothetical protein Tco_1456685 [Tanacetum coccineum]